MTGAPCLFVPSRVHRELRRLARDADNDVEGSEEIGGVLRVIDDTAVEFEQWENVSSVPSGWFEFDETQHRLPEPPSFIVHSHPGDKAVILSKGDAAWMRETGLALGVYAPGPDLLEVFRAGAGGKIFQLPVRVLRDRWIRPPLARPGRR